MRNFSFLFLVMSGTAALTYQVVWVRLLGLSMGATSESVSTVLAAFFLGLALGSYLVERVGKSVDSLRPYLVLELIIGISGLALLPILLNLDAFLALAGPSLGSSLTLKFIVAMFLLGIPSVSMGATFPVMASILVRRQETMGRRISQLYAFNTAGAVLGAALSGFVFIPNVGLDGAIYIAFGINMLIVIIGWCVDRRYKLSPVAMPVTSPLKWVGTSYPVDASLQKLALIVLFVTGFVAIATEVGWTKYLVIFTGSTIYGFSAILTCFLIGIALGSWAIKTRIESMKSGSLWLASGLVLLGTSLLITRATLSSVPYLFDVINQLTSAAPIIFSLKYGIVFLLLIVPTLLFGALFPISLKLYCGSLEGVRGSIGKAYAVNTIASIFGSIFAGFWFIPNFGTDKLLTLMAFLILILPFLFIPKLRMLKWRAAIITVSLFVFLSNWYLPHLDYERLIKSVRYTVRENTGDFLYVKEGKTGVISMLEYEDDIALLENNGLHEADINLSDPYKSDLIPALLGLMPYFLHSSPKTAFVVGYGGGGTTNALSFTDLESIHVVEMEPAVVDASLAVLEPYLMPGLNDSRVQLDFNDARNTLMVENKQYDLIVSQPSHPWRAGAANVFTREFFELARDKLNPGGIYGQWVNLFMMDVPTLSAIFQAFYHVFPEGFTFIDSGSGDLLLFGSGQPLRLNFDRTKERMSSLPLRKMLLNHKINDPDELMSYLGLSREEALSFAGDSPMNTDTNILTEVRLSRFLMNLDPSKRITLLPALDQYFSFNVYPYLTGEDIERRVYKLGLYLLRANKIFMAGQLSTQLAKRDQFLARNLVYEVFLTQYAIPEALEYYSKYGHWSDRVYAKHAELLWTLNRYDQARNVISRINNIKVRGITTAKLLYASGQWNTLAALSPLSDEEKTWQLLGVAQNDIVSAGAQLETMAGTDTQLIPHMKVLIKYFNSTNQNEKQKKIVDRLDKIVEEKVTLLSAYADLAIKNRRVVRARFLLDRIKLLDPDAKIILEIRRKIRQIS